MSRGGDAKRTVCPVGCDFMQILHVGDECLKFCGGDSKRSVAPVDWPGDQCVRWRSFVCSCATMRSSTAAATVAIWFCETSALAGAAMRLSAVGHCSSSWIVCGCNCSMNGDTDACSPPIMMQTFCISVSCSPIAAFKTTAVKSAID